MKIDPSRNRFAFAALALVLVLSPLPLASNRPIFWLIWAAYLFFLAGLQFWFGNGPRPKLVIGKTGKLLLWLICLQILFLLLQVIIPTSIAPRASLLALLRLLSYICFFWLLIQIINTESKRRMFLSIGFFTVAFQCILGFLLLFNAFELQVADSRIISVALPPLFVSRKDQKMVAAVALGITFFLSVGLAFLNEVRVAGFTSESQLKNALDLRVATRIPASKGPKNTTTATSIAAKFTAEPMSVYTESIRKLRVALDQNLMRQNISDQIGRVIMVVSSVPGEGKSNTSTALAQAYALSGKRTLLIDCDLRNPKIHRLLNGHSKISLIDWLYRRPYPATTAESGFHQDPTGLQVLTGDETQTRPNDQTFCSTQFQYLVNFAKQNFDIIVFDTPPVLPIADASQLVRFADGIALTVKWASTKQQTVKSALDILQESKPVNTEIIAVLSQEKGAKDIGDYSRSAYYNDKGPRNSQPFETI